MCSPRWDRADLFVVGRATETIRIHQGRQSCGMQKDASRLWQTVAAKRRSPEAVWFGEVIKGRVPESEQGMRILGVRLVQFHQNRDEIVTVHRKNFIKNHFHQKKHFFTNHFLANHFHQNFTNFHPIPSKTIFMRNHICPQSLTVGYHFHQRIQDNTNLIRCLSSLNQAQFFIPHPTPGLFINT